MELSRRKFLTGLTAVTGAGALVRRSRTIVKTATATRTGGSTDTDEFSVLIHKGSALRLVLLRDETQVLTQPITSDSQAVTLAQPIGTGGYVRVELRGEPFTERLDMEAITNPIFLANGPEPAGNEPVEVPPNP